jgi:tryptophan 2,3-dioxygenase
MITSLKNSKAEIVLQRVLKILVENNKNLTVRLVGAEKGFAIEAIKDGKVYSLITQRREVRIFKSPSTAFQFLSEMGVEKFEVVGLERWNVSN